MDGLTATDRMIVAITGGTGFIGRALVRRLASQPDVGEIRVLSRRPQAQASPGTRWIQGDLAMRDSAPLAALAEGADVLIHCAGELRRDSAMRGVHVEGTRRLADAAAGKVRRWVQLSSVGAYGRGLRQGSVDERSPLAPEGEYERTKVEADTLVAQAATAGAFTAVTLRPSIVFGPQMPNRSLAQLALAVRRGWFAYIGAAAATANYVYVDDVADALALAATDPRAHGCFNLSDDRPMHVFIGALAAALGVPAPSRRVPEAPLRWLARAAQRIPGSPLTEARIDALTRNVRYPADRIRAELGFEFRVPVEEGLRRYVASLGSRR